MNATDGLSYVTELVTGGGQIPGACAVQTEWPDTRNFSRVREFTDAIKGPG